MRNALLRLKVLRVEQSRLQPKNAVAWDRLGVALQARGVWNNETEKAYRRAVELDPQFAVAYAHLARVLNKTRRPTNAAPFYEKASATGKRSGDVESDCRVAAGGAAMGKLRTGFETRA